MYEAVTIIASVQWPGENVQDEGLSFKAEVQKA